MNTPNTPAELRKEFGTFAAFFEWIDKHPRTAAALLWIQAAALVYFLYTYNFTTAL